MASKPHRLGSEFETDVLRYLRENGLTADRLAKAGTKDEGDIVFEADGEVFILELKARRDAKSSHNLHAWLKEAQVEAKHYAGARNLLKDPLPVLVVKNPNHSLDEAFVVLRLKDFISE